MDAGVHAMGDDHGMSIDDESHRKPSPFRSAQESSDPVAPRALSIDEEWAVIMALEEERGRAHAPEQTARCSASSHSGGSELPRADRHSTLERSA